MGVAFAQGRIDHGPDSFRIAEHLVVPEPQDPISLRFDQPCSSGIYFRPMLTPVDFDHQACAMAREVGGEHPDRHLKAKARIREVFAQKPPHRPLGIGRIAA